MTNPFFLKSLYLGAALLGFGSLLVSAESGQACKDAWLLDYQPSAEVLKITPKDVSGRKPPEVALGEGLCAGDKITLVGDGSVEIAIAGQDEPLTLFRPSKDKDDVSEVIIADSSGDASEGFWLLGELKDIFASWAPGYYSVGKDNLIMRGPDDAIEIAIMPSEITRLVAGTRTVALLWSGGQAPYRLTLAKDGAEIFATDAEQHALPTTDIDFNIGDYELTISDAKGKSFERRIKVVAEAPEAPEDLMATIKNERFSRVVESGWLSTVEEGAWRWEAMLQILPYAQSDPAAAGLTRALLNGDHPVKLE